MKYGISISEIASPKHAQSTLAKNNATHRGGMRALRIWIKKKSAAVTLVTSSWRVEFYHIKVKLRKYKAK